MHARPNPHIHMHTHTHTHSTKVERERKKTLFGLVWQIERRVLWRADANSRFTYTYIYAYSYCIYTQSMVTCRLLNYNYDRDGRPKCCAPIPPPKCIQIRVSDSFVAEARSGSRTKKTSNWKSSTQWPDAQSRNYRLIMRYWCEKFRCLRFNRLFGNPLFHF